MKSMYIGSGDVSALLMGKNTDGHAKLFQKFVSGDKPYYNAKASPIDALRTGAILEERYFLIMPDDYYTQEVVIAKEMDVLRCSLDFAKIENGKVADFTELKTCNFNDFLAFEPYREQPETALPFIKKAYKKNYEQVQQQLFCTGLESANLTFLAVYSYDDEINNVRDIQQNEFITFRIFRDELVIAKILERATVFQYIKDYLGE